MLSLMNFVIKLCHVVDITSPDVSNEIITNMTGSTGKTRKKTNLQFHSFMQYLQMFMQAQTHTHVHTCSPFTLLFNCFYSLSLTFFLPPTPPQYSPTLLSFRLNKCNLAGKRLRIQMLCLSHSLILHYPPCPPFSPSLLTPCFYHES